MCSITNKYALTVILSKPSRDSFAISFRKYAQNDTGGRIEESNFGSSNKAVIYFR